MRSLSRMGNKEERFTKNIDKFGEGLSVFICDAMADYADNIK